MRTANPVEFSNGQLIGWSPPMAAAMLLRGVKVDGRWQPRRRVAQCIWWALTGWATWYMALPGDRFWHAQRDLIVQVEHGVPGRRTARIVVGEAMSYRSIQNTGLDAFMTLIEPEPCHFQWWEMWPYLPRAKNQEGADERQ